MHVTHGGLAAGDHVMLWLRSDGFDDCAEVVAEDSSNDGGHRPELHIVWQLPSR
jgi:hypothetical protein